MDMFTPHNNFVSLSCRLIARLLRRSDKIVLIIDLATIKAKMLKSKDAKLQVYGSA